MVITAQQLPHMSADELREAVQSLFKTLTFKQTTIDKLTHENAICWRRLNTDHLCQLNFDQGLKLAV